MTTETHAYDFWLAAVRKRLTVPEAETTISAKALELCFGAGFASAYMAAKLNARWAKQVQMKREREETNGG